MVCGNFAHFQLIRGAAWRDFSAEFLVFEVETVAEIGVNYVE